LYLTDTLYEVHNQCGWRTLNSTHIKLNFIVTYLQHIELIAKYAEQYNKVK